jgi:hypothetical protein
LAAKSFLREELMQSETEVLLFLRNNGGASLRSQVCEKVFKNHIMSADLDKLLATVLSGLVTARKRKNRETWKLTTQGWAASANQITAPEAQPMQAEPISTGFARFREIVEQNPDCSVQRALQLAGRHLGDPLEDSEQWRSFRAQNPEWYLLQPKDWYSSDVAVDESGYPLRYPTDPLTAKEREVRPTTEQGWFDRAMRQTGASLEPFAVEMPAYECANILRVCKKVGEQNALDIFGAAKIATARRLAGLEQSGPTVNS